MSREPLTTEQQKLATDYIPCARKIVKYFKDCWPNEADEYDSAALAALVEAAQSFDPTLEVKFATFLRYRVLGAVKDLQRQIMVQGYGASNEHTRHVHGFIAVAEEFGEVLLCTPDPPTNQDLDSVDEMELWFSKLPPRYATVCRETYLNDRTQEQVARIVGVSKSRVSYILKESSVILKDVITYRRRGA